jgi:L-lactate dehydrogenase complex protein LldG
MAGAEMSARDDILAAVRRRGEVTAPPGYAPPPIADPIGNFVTRARNSHAQVHRVRTDSEIPEAVLALLSAAGAAMRVHLPRKSALRDLPWHRVPALELSDATPGQKDSAIALADHGIAETGTVVFGAGPHNPSSWHFLPGREIIVLRAECVAATFEEIPTRVPVPFRMPSTVNLITGPSRTGDIEQTMERGAHGPRDVDILLVG